MMTPIQHLMEKWTQLDSEEFEVYFANNYTELQEREKQVIMDAHEKGGSEEFFAEYPKNKIFDLSEQDETYKVRAFAFFSTMYE